MQGDARPPAGRIVPEKAVGPGFPGPDQKIRQAGGGFVYLVRTRPKAESPTQEMLRDAPFMINLFIWIAIVVAIVYKLRPSA